MFRIETRVQLLPAGRDINVSDRANEQRMRRSWSGPLSWFLVQPALPGSSYALTANGYVVLP